MVVQGCLHDPADSGLALRPMETRPVPDQHGLVSKAAVPGGLVPVQVGGGRSLQHQLLLLLPDEQRRVPVPKLCEGLRQGLLCQARAAGTGGLSGHVGFRSWTTTLNLFTTTVGFRSLTIEDVGSKREAKYGQRLFLRR